MDESIYKQSKIRLTSHLASEKDDSIRILIYILKIFLDTANEKLPFIEFYSDVII